MVHDFGNCLESSESVTNQIQKWVDEYNSFAPHSMLKMKTTNEFYIFKSAA
ncbi:MAG: putative transposase [Flavobacteriaceae bacterium]|jgi:putative transposase